MKLRQLIAFVAGCLLAGPVLATDEIDPVVNDMVLFGINRNTGDLSRYDFDAERPRHVALLRLKDGTVLQKIDAGAYIPGHRKFIAFWTDPGTSESRMLYVDPADEALGARVSVVGQSLGKGRVTGAVAARGARVATISGKVNINPNNADHMEFVCTRGDGSTFRRDELHKKTPISGDGTYYQGSASYVRVRAKSGKRSTTNLLVDGIPLGLGSNWIYELYGDMQVRVYNDHPRNGKAMGHWWIEFADGRVLVDGVQNEAWSVFAVQQTPAASGPAALYKIDPGTAEKMRVMPLSRVYDSLATLDGTTFYATEDEDLYRLDVLDQSETRVGEIDDEHTLALEFAGQTLLGFERVDDKLWAVKPSTGERLGMAMSIGMYDLGTMVLMLGDDVPDWHRDMSCD
ncbi:MAG: hypothetical protein ACLFV3_03645 [Phycisphaeraceae bacterium]